MQSLLTASIEFVFIGSVILFATQFVIGFSNRSNRPVEPVEPTALPTIPQQPTDAPEAVVELPSYAAAAIAPAASLTVAIEAVEPTESTEKPLTRRGLLAIAKERKIPGYSRMVTEELREAVALVLNV